MNIIKERRKKAKKLMKKPRTKFRLLSEKEMVNALSWMHKVYANNRFMVFVTENYPTTKGECIRVLVQAHDNLPINNHWAKMQRIKNEIFGKETVAIEYYPKESELVNQHNIYWMWIFPEGVLPVPFNI